MITERSQIPRLAKRVVVKMGSGVLAGGTGGLHPPTLRRLAGDAARARKEGRELVLVSSGAILAGFERLKRPRAGSIELKQAAAAIGQSRLMAAWTAAMRPHGLLPAQVLLTADDVRHRRRYLHARNTLRKLLELDAVPVVNENDTVAIEELQFGENDILSALVATLVDADLLVLLTDIDGLHTADPRDDASARRISRVGPEDKTAYRIGEKGLHGTGGMQAKVRAAAQAAAGGVPAVLANGLLKGTLPAVLEGRDVGTLFVGAPSAWTKRKQWLAFAAAPKGGIEVDEGARLALSEKGRSLLPSGVRAAKGSFQSGDVVGLWSDGKEFARGLTNYGSSELERIRGLKTAQIEAALGAKKADEVVHRDNMVLLGGGR